MRLIQGVGINDTKGESNSRAYVVWTAMLYRCYNDKFWLKRPTYKDCSVCEEWLLFSNFKSWYEVNSVEDWELDKDVLVTGNKIYSPDTCIFLPAHLNSIMLRSTEDKKSKLPIGIRKHKLSSKYQVHVRVKGSNVYLGLIEGLQRAYTTYTDYKVIYSRDLINSYDLPENIKQRLIASIKDTLSIEANKYGLVYEDNY